MRSKKTAFLFLFLLAISLSATYYNYVNKQDITAAECDLTTETCTFPHEYGKIAIKFLSQIVVEEEILLSIDLPKGVELQSAWIEGINMYMGKTPIIKEGSTFLTFLGSCNLAKMQWRLHLLVENKSGQVTKYSAVFHTSQK